MQIMGKLSWSVIITLGLIGVITLFIMLMLGDLLLISSPIDLFPALIVSTCISGVLGGLIAHDWKRGLAMGIIVAIPVLIVLGALLLSSIALEYIKIVDMFYNPIIFPDEGQRAMLWMLPGVIILISVPPTGAVGGFISQKFIEVSKRRPGEIKLKKTLKQRFALPLVLLVFILSWTPLILPLFSLDNSTTKQFSAWNTGPDGTSNFRQALRDEGYENVYSCITSYSLLSRSDENTVLVVLGPSKFFNPISDVPFLLKFLQNNGSLLVADDHGSTEWLMRWLFYLSLPDVLGNMDLSNSFPLMFFPNGILRDNLSYYKQNNAPVINAGLNSSHPINDGVDSIVTLNSSGLMLLVPFLRDAFGWSVIAESSDKFSWIDVDNDGVYDKNVDKWSLPYDMALLLAMMGAIVGDIELGGVPIPVAATAEIRQNGTRIVCTSDASMFTNQLTSLPGFDNMRFAVNAINWLTGGDKSYRIVFDEAHLGPSGVQDMTAQGIYGTFLNYVAYSSANWIIAPFYAFVALMSLRAWLPKSERKKQKEIAKKRKKLERVEAKKHRQQVKRNRRIGGMQYSQAIAYQYRRQGRSALALKQGALKRSTFFMEKLQWYTESGTYNKAVGLLYNRIARAIGKKIGPLSNHEMVADAIVEKNPNVNRAKLMDFFSRVDRIIGKAGPAITIDKAEVFEKFYFEMISIQEYIDGL